MYVKEAYRLLQKSIIFVETDDIDLEDNEEVCVYVCVYVFECVCMV